MMTMDYTKQFTFFGSSRSPTNHIFLSVVSQRKKRAKFIEREFKYRPFWYQSLNNKSSYYIIYLKAPLFCTLTSYIYVQNMFTPQHSGLMPDFVLILAHLSWRAGYLTWVVETCIVVFSKKESLILRKDQLKFPQPEKHLVLCLLKIRRSCGKSNYLFLDEKQQEKTKNW